ncbi:hypothetical protein M231_04341 [Tremella mesenterica]|uniref:Uncharacterized protein n=1 Tax=Tremella mesenterica TaxID=5217 RepID=A0A4Q1BLC5_TREME|nr:hypothetical protein M231_04341 [Tremella mesenterica]
METNIGDDTRSDDFIRKFGPSYLASLESSDPARLRLAACAGAYKSLFRLQLYFSQPPDTRKLTWSPPSMDHLNTALSRSRLSLLLLDKEVPTDINIDGDYDAGTHDPFETGTSLLKTDVEKIANNNGLQATTMYDAKNRENQSSKLVQPSDDDVARMQAAERVASYVLLFGYKPKPPEEWPSDTPGMLVNGYKHRTVAEEIRTELETGGSGSLEPPQLWSPFQTTERMTQDRELVAEDVSKVESTKRFSNSVRPSHTRASFDAEASNKRADDLMRKLRAQDQLKNFKDLLGGMELDPATQAKLLPITSDAKQNDLVGHHGRFDPR